MNWRTAVAIIAALNIPLSMWLFHYSFSRYLDSQSPLGGPGRKVKAK